MGSDSGRGPWRTAQLSLSLCHQGAGPISWRAERPPQVGAPHRDRFQKSFLEPKGNPQLECQTILFCPNPWPMPPVNKAHKLPVGRHLALPGSLNPGPSAPSPSQGHSDSSARMKETCTPSPPCCHPPWAPTASLCDPRDISLQHFQPKLFWSPPHGACPQALPLSADSGPGSEQSAELATNTLHLEHTAGQLPP